MGTKEKEDMKITIAQLRAMVGEELSKAAKKKVRKKRIFGYDPEDHVRDEYLDALGHGIIRDGCEGNSNHDMSGRWASKETNGSWSLPKRVGCKRGGGQYKRKKAKKVGDRSPCGRKDRSSLCSEGKDVVDNQCRSLNKDIERTIKDAVTKELQRQAEKHNCSMNDMLRIINTIELAQAGKLNSKAD
jgi:hypothetical protein